MSKRAASATSRKAKGLRAKTDPIAAAVLSEYGRLLQPAATAAPTPRQARLAELSTRRRQLLGTLTAESNRAAHDTDKLCVRQARQLRQALEKQIEACDTAIAKLIAADEILQAQAERLDAIPGVGAVTAATVLAEMPELGKISDGAAALVGVAPTTTTAATTRSPGTLPAVARPCATRSTWPR